MSRIACCLLSALLLSCSSKIVEPIVPEDVSALQDLLAEDLTSQDTAVDILPTEDTSQPETTQADTQISDSIEPGGIGYPCEGSDDCNNGYCVQSADG